MSEINGLGTGELAYLLWERQGRPENRSLENWLEAEYLKHPMAPSYPATNADVEMRMRGLGPLTQVEPPMANEIADPSGGGAVKVDKEDSRQGKSAVGTVIVPCLVGAVVMIAIGMAFSLFRKHV